MAGQPSPNPSYDSNGYGLVLTGHPFFPGISRPSNKDSASLSFAGQIATTLVNDYATVPSDLERAGNFSQPLGPTGELVPIYPPGHPVPYPNNTIDNPLDPVALVLLQYLPKANLTGTGLNYRLITPQGTHTNTIGAGYTHSFATTTAASSDNSQSLSVNFNLSRVANDVINGFPAFGGKCVVQGYALTAAYAVNRTHLFSNFGVTSNRNNAELRNHFTDVKDVATEAGVLEDSFGHRLNSNPINYGLPNPVLNNFTSLNQTQPNYQLTQAIGVSASSSWEQGTQRGGPWNSAPPQTTPSMSFNMQA